jgi:hypothetical protein
MKENEQQKIEKTVTPNAWAQLCELIQYYIFEGQLDEKFVETAKEIYELKKK